MNRLDPDALVVIHGFLALPNKTKMQVVDAMNEYFDSDEKEGVRAKFDESFAKLLAERADIECVCCGRK